MRFEPNGGVHVTGDIVPEGQRGKITGEFKGAGKQTNRKPTNREYAQQHGTTTRQASKRRRGY